MLNVHYLLISFKLSKPNAQMINASKKINIYPLIHSLNK